MTRAPKSPLPLLRAAVVLATALTSATLLPATAGLAAVALPDGFVSQQVVRGLARPIDMELAPDGRLFVLEQAGRVRVLRDNGTLATFVDLRSRVDDTDERGLVGIAFDPRFETNHHVYLDLTRKATATRGVHNQVLRVTASGNRTVPGSARVIFRLDQQASTHHVGGSLDFGPDGKLYISTGDDLVGANAPRLSSLSGKLVRINRSGSIPTSNPFYARTTGRNRAIWARGLRNPFKIAFHPRAGTLFVNDVGQDTWEEINQGRPGRHYGWPVHEGEESAPRHTPPLLAYRHGSSPSRGCAITGGTFYDPATDQFPPRMVGDYFFADLCGGWIRRYDVATDSAHAFATGFPTKELVDLEVTETGDLYVLRRSGVVTRIGLTSG